MISSPAMGMDRFDIITTQQLNQLMAERTRGEVNFQLINTLDSLIYEHHSIPGSLNIPWLRISEIGEERLGADREQLIITYCMGYRWVFAYKAAVAVKALGYKNIKIYNGGIKDWKKSGLPLASINPLPDVSASFISSDLLKDEIDTAEKNQCIDNNGAPQITLLDLRNEYFLQPDKPLADIDTVCRTIKMQLDDLLKADVRAELPQKGMLVTVTETGNRDVFVKRYLSKYGYDNITGLHFGMRDWIKKGYPIR